MLTSWLSPVTAELDRKDVDLQGVLNWVGRPAPGKEPFKFEARLYDTLFCGEDPSKLGDDWIQDLNPASRTVVSGAMGTPPVVAATAGTRYNIYTSERYPFVAITDSH